MPREGPDINASSSSIAWPLDQLSGAINTSGAHGAQRWPGGDSGMPWLGPRMVQIGPKWIHLGLFKDTFSAHFDSNQINLGLFKMDISIFWLETENDHKKSHICPIWGQSDPILSPLDTPAVTQWWSSGNNSDCWAKTCRGNNSSWGETRQGNNSACCAWPTLYRGLTSVRTSRPGHYQTIVHFGLHLREYEWDI